MAPRIPGIEPDQGVIGNHRKGLGIFDKHQTFHQLSNFNIKFVSELKDPKMDLMGSCDCYLKFSLQNQERQTSDVTGYNGEWNESVCWDGIVGRNCALLVEAWDKVMA